MGELSSILFARPSAIEGAARLLDFGDTLSEYNRSPTGAMADYIALAADWKQIGNDLSEAFQLGMDELSDQAKAIESD